GKHAPKTTQLRRLRVSTSSRSVIPASEQNRPAPDYDVIGLTHTLHLHQRPDHGCFQCSWHRSRIRPGYNGLFIPGPGLRGTSSENNPGCMKALIPTWLHETARPNDVRRSLSTLRPSPGYIRDRTGN